MKTQDIKKMAQAWLQVQEASKKKMDKVDAKELEKDYKDREDKDIDNDGDEDESDEYLHNRRKAVKKAIAKEEVEQIDELKKSTLASYVKKASGNMAGKTAVQVAKVSSSNGKADPDLKRGLVNRMKGIGRAADKLAKEEVEQIDEIGDTLAGKKKLKNLIVNRTQKAVDAGASLERKPEKAAQYDKAQKRHMKTIGRAAERLAKEEVELGEAKWMVTYKKEQGTTGKYIDSTQFHPDERSARMHKGKLKITPGVLKGSIAMKKVHYQDMAKEEVQHFEEAATHNPGVASPAGEGLSPNAKKELDRKTEAPAAVDINKVLDMNFKTFKDMTKKSKSRPNDNQTGDKEMPKNDGK